MIQKYLSAVRSLDIAAYRSGAAAPSLTMYKAGDLAVEYAPFDHIEANAELAIVGLTPGRTQASNALVSLARDLASGLPVDVSLANAKRTASFSGPMRNQLLALLDEIGLPAVFSRSRAADFYAADNSLVHFTSALRYPVYLAGDNYSGSPGLLREPYLRSMVESHLAEEVTAIPKAIWVPLGSHAETALLYLVAEGRLPRDKVLAGLPHPSGANAERIAYFLGRKAKEALSAKTNPGKIDAAKSHLKGQVDRLRSKLAK